MIQQARYVQQTPAPGTASMVGNKIPMLHRVHLTTGRVMTGNMHRAPNTRLADHLSTLKGLISLTDVVCEDTGDAFPYIVVNMDNILFFEELGAHTRPDATSSRVSGIATAG